MKPSKSQWEEDLFHKYIAYFDLESKEDEEKIFEFMREVEQTTRQDTIKEVREIVENSKLMGGIEWGYKLSDKAKFVREFNGKIDDLLSELDLLEK